MLACSSSESIQVLKTFTALSVHMNDEFPFISSRVSRRLQNGACGGPAPALLRPAQPPPLATVRFFSLLKHPFTLIYVGGGPMHARTDISYTEKYRDLQQKYRDVQEKYLTRNFVLECSISSPVRSIVHRNGTYPTLKTFLCFLNNRSFEGVEAPEGCENVA
jgi:hypothetical protein